MLFFDLPQLIETAGYIGIGAIVFAESGLFFGFFLPGDTLLFTSGFLAAQDLLNIWILVPLIVVAAILGDTIGYWSGKKAGPLIFTREESFWFSRKRVLQAEVFFERHGGKSIIFARFIPFVRTFTPIVAGAANMRYKTFLIYNIIGGFLWGAGLTLSGFLLGEAAPQIEKYLIPTVIICFLVFTSSVTLIPIVKRIIERRKPSENNQS